MSWRSKKKQPPMFAKESQMTASVSLWLENCGMKVRSEFITPWGMCDLVGLRFNPQNVAHRLQQKQTRAISSITRAILLLKIPDIESKKWTTVKSLVSHYSSWISEEIILNETARLIADRFIISSPRGRLQKINGWIPLQEQLVAVELKLSKIEEAMRQALNNLGFAEESYVALPEDSANRVLRNLNRWADFMNEGIGLLGVSSNNCTIMIPARKTKNHIDTAIQLYCVEKFWHSRIKGS
jgi:hypothetical protein